MFSLNLVNKYKKTQIKKEVHFIIIKIIHLSLLKQKHRVNKLIRCQNNNNSNNKLCIVSKDMKIK